MNIAILGDGGMSKILQDMIIEIGARDDVKCIGAIEPLRNETLLELTERPDVIIDFSHPDNIKALTEYAVFLKCGFVIATTGFSVEQELIIQKAAQKIPVVYAANFSMGITIMKQILSQISPVLEQEFDIEIIEMHHNKKLDAPSGTAKALLRAIDPDSKHACIYGRFGNGKRQSEIAIHALRGGTVAGEHSVIFAGQDEILEITHKAGSRKIFAAGALKAAHFTCESGPGLYSMEDVLCFQRI